MKENESMMKSTTAIERHQLIPLSTFLIFNLVSEYCSALDPPHLTLFIIYCNELRTSSFHCVAASYMRPAFRSQQHLSPPKIISSKIYRCSWSIHRLIRSN
jgi:hypothetical protein